MPGHSNRSAKRSTDQASLSFSRTLDGLQDVPEPESRLLRPSDPSAKFDTQVTTLPLRFQAMTRIAGAETTAVSKSRLEDKRSPNSSGNRVEEDEEELGGRAPSPLSCNRKEQRRSKTGECSLTSMQAEPPVGLVVALFHDGFVCRHINKENESVDGFAQPYDTESSYFLACIDNGRVPEGLPDMIACAHYKGSVLTEIRDYRDMGTALCPVSSAFLPAASALPQVEDDLDSDCCVWQTLLLPGESSSPINAHLSQVFEPPTVHSMFDHFPDVTPSELETLAIDAKRQLLQEEDMLLSSSSTESSSPRDESRGFCYFPADEGRENDASLTTTPTTRSRSQSGLVVSPPASLLSPLERKSARSRVNGQEDNSTKRCKRQIQTKAKRAYNRRDQNSNEGSGTSREPNLEKCGSPRNVHTLTNRDSQNDDCAAVTPLPATQLFLSRLKGKRRRPDNELVYGKPAWVTIAHVGRFFRAATRLEREHSRFLLVNARRLMQVDKPSPAETEHVAGSMRYLARQLGNITRPSDVIAVAGARELKAAEDEGRDIVEPDWTTTKGSSTPVWQPAEACVALVTPDDDLAFHLPIETEEDILLGQFLELATETTSLAKDYEPTASAPHFNAFDDDGNLQPQSA